MSYEDDVEKIIDLANKIWKEVEETNSKEDPSVFIIAEDIIYGEPYVTKPSPRLFGFRKEKKCECGVDKAGGGIHSDWCPKYE